MRPAYAARSQSPRWAVPTPVARRSPPLTRTSSIGNQAMLRRTPCDDAKTCAKPAKGDPGAFGASVEPVEAARAATQAAAPAGSAEAKLGARNGERAVSFENLLKAHGIALRPEMAGFFVNSAMREDEDGGITDICGRFPGGSPGTPPAPADKFCTQMPPETVDKAKAIDGKGKTPLSEAEKKDLAWILSTGVHEMEHAAFDKVQNDPGARTIGPEGGCTLDTPAGVSTVEGMLTEIAAETAEFSVYFQNLAGEKAHTKSLLNEERMIGYKGDESILGAIKKLRCACSCTAVDSFVVQTVNPIISAWPEPQKLAYLQAMTRILPSYWPKSLQRKE